MNTEPWTQKFFNLRYLGLFMSRTPEQCQHEANLIASATHLEPDMSVADFCCGCGDILSEIAKKCSYGRGVELCADYVDLAHTLYPGVTIDKANALTHHFGRRFDVSYNWFSSFGYLGAQSDQELINNMVFHTKPGGYVLVETYNTNSVLDTFQPTFVYSKVWQGQQYEITRESQLNLSERRLDQCWTFTVQGSTPTIVDQYHTSSHLYLPSEIAEILKKSGLRHLILGETPPLSAQTNELLPLTRDSRRVTIIGVAP